MTSITDRRTARRGAGNMDMFNYQMLAILETKEERLQLMRRMAAKSDTIEASLAAIEKAKGEDEALFPSSTEEERISAWEMKLQMYSPELLENKSRWIARFADNFRSKEEDLDRGGENAKDNEQKRFNLPPLTSGPIKPKVSTIKDIHASNQILKVNMRCVFCWKAVSYLDNECFTCYSCKENYHHCCSEKLLAKIKEEDYEKFILLQKHNQSLPAASASTTSTIAGDRLNNANKKLMLCLLCADSLNQHDHFSMRTYNTKYYEHHSPVAALKIQSAWRSYSQKMAFHAIKMASKRIQRLQRHRSKKEKK